MSSLNGPNGQSDLNDQSDQMDLDGLSNPSGQTHGKFGRRLVIFTCIALLAGLVAGGFYLHHKDDGYGQGRADGYSAGKTDGYGQGKAAGYAAGYTAGKADEKKGLGFDSENFGYCNISVFSNGAGVGQTIVVNCQGSQPEIMGAYNANESTFTQAGSNTHMGTTTVAQLTKYLNDKVVLVDVKGLSGQFPEMSFAITLQQ